MTTSPTTVSPTKLWAKRIVLAMIVIIIIAVIAESFGSSGIGGIGGTTKTLELEVSSLQPHQLCGILPGERKFNIPNKSFVMIDGDDYEINTYVRVNGSLPNESFTVDSTGCTTVSFAFTKRALGRAITPQILQIALK